MSTTQGPYQPTLTPDGARVLQLLAAGRTTQQAADASSWPRERVTALAKAQKGWLLDPDSDKVYDPNRKDCAVTLPAEIAELSERAGRADGPTFETALARAEASNDPRLRKLAATARTALDELMGRLINAHQAAALAKEIEQLQQQLAAKQARHRELAGRKTPGARASEPKAPEAKRKRAGIRAWAAQQGLDCPTQGRIPKTVETAYDRAHGGTS